MKTKVTILLAVLVGFFTNVKAQEAECVEKLSIFNELCKTGNFEEAYEPWKFVYKTCPGLHEATYLRGDQILRYRIDNVANDEEKEKEVRGLMEMYDAHDKYFPNNNKGNTAKKALALFDNNVGTKKEVFQILDEAFKKDRENFNNARAMYVYFEIFVDNYEEGKMNIELQEVFDKYDLISDKLEEETRILSEAKDELIKKEETEELTEREKRDFNRYEVNLEAYQTIATSMDNKISLLATCDRLIPFLEKSFEDRKTDEEWLRRAADRLYRKDCSSDPLFTKISEALHKLNPTAKSAYNLGVAAYNNKNISKASEYFNQAAELQKDPTEKAKVYYTIATIVHGMSNKAQARIYAEKALAVKPSFGKAYLFIAQLYGNSVNECGDTPFEKRAINWLAAQTARKAGQVDSTLKAAAEQQASSYEQRAPTRSEIFSEGAAGKTISFKCWVGKSVTVPNL